MFTSKRNFITPIFYLFYLLPCMSDYPKKTNIHSTVVVLVDPLLHTRSHTAIFLSDFIRSRLSLPGSGSRPPDNKSAGPHSLCHCDEADASWDIHLTYSRRHQLQHSGKRIADLVVLHQGAFSLNQEETASS